MPEAVMETPAFDSAAFLESRNAAEAARKPMPAKPAEVETKPAEGTPEPEAPKAADPGKPAEPEAVRIPRSVRRQLNHAMREAAELKGRLAAYEQMGIKPAIAKSEEPESAADPEPRLEQFNGDEKAYERAMGRWEARQEARKVSADVITKRDAAAEEQAEANARAEQMKAMDAKEADDSKALPDYDDVVNAPLDVPFDWKQHATLTGLMLTSDRRAFIKYHFAKHQDEFQRMMDLSNNPAEQIRAFARLEGKVESMYTAKQEKAAQAGGDSSSKTAMHPAEAAKPAGRTSQSDLTKPKPTSVVAANGGSAPPETPPIGSKAWMEMRNSEKFRRGY